MINTILTPSEKMLKAKVKLCRESPFFSFLVMSSKVSEAKDLERVKTACVDMYGNIEYNPKFIDSLPFPEVITVLVHEIMHTALSHCSRLWTIKKGNKEQSDMEIWNIAADLVVNDIIQSNGYQYNKLKEIGIFPYNHEFDSMGIKIKEIDKKIVEEIYQELLKQIKVTKINISIGSPLPDQSNGKTKTLRGFDSIKMPEGLSEEEKEQITKAIGDAEKSWKEKLLQATVQAKQQGKLPGGIERLVDKLLESKMNWREMLYKYVTQDLVTDYRYSKPSRRSQAAGFYLPSMKKESLEITVFVDTSGSIGEEEIIEFMSELVAIQTCFPQLKVHVVPWDTEGKDVFTLSNSYEFTNIKLIGGGGTDFKDTYKFINERIPNTKILIFFTDAYADFPKTEEYKTVWVLCKNHANIDTIPFGDILTIE